MAILEVVPDLCAGDAEFAMHPHRRGPVSAEEFETWAQEPERPLELVEGWVLPMSPGSVWSSDLWIEMVALFRGESQRRGWRLLCDARHRLPHPADTAVFPDIALHCLAEVSTTTTGTALRAPDLVVEILSPETAERDLGPRGAKFLAYQAAGVREYFYTYPDGSSAAGWRLAEGRFQTIEPDGGGFLVSHVLGGRLRLVPPALEGG